VDDNEESEEETIREDDDDDNEMMMILIAMTVAIWEERKSLNDKALSDFKTTTMQSS
jgi:hypothetical protein